MPLRRQSRRDAEQAVHERNVRHLIELVGSYGLSAGERINLAQELHGRAVTTRDEHLEVTLELDDLDRARVLADVWREGQRAS